MSPSDGQYAPSSQYEGRAVLYTVRRVITTTLHHYTIANYHHEVSTTTVQQDETIQRIAPHHSYGILLALLYDDHPRQMYTPEATLVLPFSSSFRILIPSRSVGALSTSLIACCLVSTYLSVSVALCLFASLVT